MRGERANSGLSWVNLGDSHYAIYFGSDSSILLPVTDYSIFLSDIQDYDSKTVQSNIWNIKTFFDYLQGRKLSLNDISDDEIEQYRDVEVNYVQSRRNSQNNDRTAKRTVNAKLKSIYRFLVWYQDRGNIKGLIGSRHCKVNSKLPSAIAAGADRKRFSDRDCYPKIFRNVGSKSRHAIKHWATLDQHASILALIRHSTENPYIVNRNVLMLDLADQVGLRRESIASLTTDDFSKNLIDKMETSGLRVQPRLQKFDYQKSSYVPFRLAIRIRSFIDNERAALLNSNGWTESKAKNHLFLSVRDGKPLSVASISQIYGDLFRKLKIQGASIHSFRRKYTMDRIRKEVRARKFIGMATDANSILLAVSKDLWHSNPESILPYIDHVIGEILRDQSPPPEEMQDILQQRIGELVEENEQLRRKNEKGIKKSRSRK